MNGVQEQMFDKLDNYIFKPANKALEKHPVILGVALTAIGALAVCAMAHAPFLGSEGDIVKYGLMGVGAAIGLGLIVYVITLEKSKENRRASEIQAKKAQDTVTGLLKVCIPLLLVGVVLIAFCYWQPFLVSPSWSSVVPAALGIGAGAIGLTRLLTLGKGRPNSTATKVIRVLSWMALLGAFIWLGAMYISHEHIIGLQYLLLIGALACTVGSTSVTSTKRPRPLLTQQNEPAT